MRRIIDYSLILVLVYLLFAANAVAFAYRLLHSPQMQSQGLEQTTAILPQPAIFSESGQVSITDDGFLPAVITVTLGTEVTWINDGSLDHGVATTEQEPPRYDLFLPLIVKGQASAPAGLLPAAGQRAQIVAQQGWHSGKLLPGSSYRRAFNQPGAYPYYDPFRPESEGVVVVIEANQAPAIEITSPNSGDVLGPGPVQVNGTITADGGGLTVLVNGLTAQVSGNTYSVMIPPTAGNLTIQAEVQDLAGLVDSASVVVYIDGQPPEIQINSPKNRQVAYVAQPAISASTTDFRGQVDTNSVQVLLQEEGIGAIDISSSLVITSGGISGQVPTALTGGAVYTLTIEAGDSFGNSATQSSTFYVADPPGSIQPPSSTNQSGWVSGRVYDSSTCDIDLITCQGLSGAQVTLEAVNVSLIAAVRQQRQNQVLSRLLDEDGFKPLDPMHSTVATTALTGTVLTGPDGFFAFPADATGVYWLRAEKDSYTYGQREIEIVREQSTATNAIYLTPQDSVVTPCDDTGCSHANSDNSLALEIPPGAVPAGETINLRATWFSNVEFLPSGELPDGTAETYAFDLSAGSEITFTTPVTVQVRNERNFSPGTPIPVGYWNQLTQEWEHVGVSTVDGSGQWLVFTATHFSPFDTNIPVFPPDVEMVIEEEQPPDPANQDPTAKGPADKKDEPCNDGSSGCFVGLKSGVLQEWVDLPTVDVLGQAEAPRMQYSTGRANRTELIDARVVMNNIGSSFLKDYMIFELSIAGETTEIHYIPVMTDTIGELGRFRYLWDGVDSQGQPMPPGIYDYTVKFIIRYTAEFCRAVGDVFGGPPECSEPIGIFRDGEFELTQSGTVILDGEDGSALGDGWVVQGQQRLYENERGQIAIMDGIRHDEFYFPQKNLLLADIQTLSAASSYAQLSEGLKDGQKITAQDETGLNIGDEQKESWTAPQLLPEVAFVTPLENQAYREQRSADSLATDVCGDISGPGTWDLAGSPYLVTCDIIIFSSGSLTIDPGVIVQFQPGFSMLVFGNLSAVGTAVDPIIFQAEAGNSPGTWRQISFSPGSTGELDQVIVEHGGNIPNNATLGAITIASSQVSIINSTFQKNQTALFISAAAPIISNTHFISNTATYGAAIYMQNNAGPILENNRFQENQASIDGGAIYAQNSSFAITGSEFLTNTAQSNGGGIFLNNGTVTIQGNLFSANTAQSRDGGGVYIYNEAEPSLVWDNNFIQNNATNGGGGALYNDSYNNTIRGNYFISNTASGGGAITHHDYFGLPDSTVFSENLFQGNGAQRGGAMLVREGDPLLINNTFSSNNATYAGALSLWSRAFVEHNVFWNNSASYGGAITNHVGDVIPVLTNNILVNNTATQAGSGGAINSEGIDEVSFGDYNLVWGNSNPQYYLVVPGAHDIQADPLFVDPSQMDFHLMPGSPAIDAGDWRIRTNFDAEGDMRPMGNSPDIGIDESPAFGVNIQDFPNSIGAGEVSSYSLQLFNPEGAARPFTLTHTVPLHSTLLGIEDGLFSCIHDGAPAGGSLACDGTILPGSQAIISLTIETAEAVLNPVIQNTLVNAASNGQTAADQAEGWLEWCRVKVNDDPVTTNLKNVINSASDGDLVRVSGRCLIGAPLDIRDDLTLQGGWDRTFSNQQTAIYTTTLDGGFAEPVLETRASSIIEGFLIIHGVDQSNGVIQLSGESTAVFQSNEVAYNIGSGISSSNDSTIIQDNNIHHNQGYYYGAGIYSRSISNLIRNNRIHHNFGAENGGGIFVDRAGTVQNNIIHDNVAQFDGGGLYFSGYQFDPVTIEYNVLYENQASRGGGMAIDASNYDVNSAFRNNIVVNNTATSGGGIYQPTAFDGSRFNNVWNNNGGDYAGAPASTFDVSLAPMFEDPANGDFHLKTDSPMIDIGDPLSNFVPDFEGDPRPLGERVDIGADEYRSLSAFSKTSTDYSRLEFDLVEENYVRIYPDQTRVVFDAENRHNYTLAPDGKKTGYSYNPDGSLASISITAPGETNPSWIWTFNYLNGRLDGIVDPAGRVTDVTIDQNNHLTDINFPDGSERLFIYDSRGLLTQQFDQNGQLTDYGYDDHGRTRLIAYPVRTVYETTSDSSSLIRETRVITPSDTAYPLLNDRLPGSPTNPGSGVPTSGDLLDVIQYGRGSLSGTTDRWGFLVDQTDGLGRTTNFRRFTSGLPKQTTFPDGDCVEFAYNSFGSPVTETRMPPDQCALEEAQRDENRLLVWEWRYEERFNKIKSETDPEGRETVYFYDYEVGAGEAGNVVKIIYPAVDDGYGQEVEPTRQFTYNAWGLLQSETDPLGTIIRYEYTQGIPEEASGGASPRFKAGVNPQPGLLARVTQDDAGEKLITKYLDYDAAGNPGQVIEPGGLLVTTFLYDPMNRVVQETDAVGVITTYRYDGNGNQVEKVVDPGGKHVVTTTLYDPHNEVVNQQIDDGNNLASLAVEYDINRMPALVVDARGERTVRLYDDADQLVNVIDPEGYVFTYTYAIDANLASETDPSGSITRYVYDNLSRRVEEIVDDGGLTLVTSYAYDSADNKISEIAPNGTKTCFTYDALDRKISETRDCGGLGLETTYAYDLNGNLLRETDQRGVTKSQSYDALNRIVGMILDDGGLDIAASYTYNGAGELEKLTDQRGNEHIHSYDALNRLAQLCEDVTGLNLCTSYSYDALGNVATTTDPKGTVTQQSYNGFSQQLQRVEDANGLARTTQYSYDNALNLATITDNNGNMTHYDYNGRNEVIEERYADGTATGFNYDGRGLRQSTMDQEGIIITNQFDGAGRQIGRSLSSGGSQSFDYDRGDRLVATVDNLSANNNRVDVLFNPVNDIVAITQTVDLQSWVTSYDYNYSTGVYTDTYPSGEERQTTLDAIGRPANLATGAGASIAQFDYQDSLGIDGLTYANGATESVSYDALQRPISSISSVADYRYAYDDASNRTSRQRPDLPGQPAEVYQYNSLYQVEKAWYGADALLPANITTFDRLVGYTQDPLSNRLSVDDGGTVESYGPNDGSQLSNPMNRYETVGAQNQSHDLNGNLINDGLNAYSYDGLNRQTSAQSVDMEARYIYNGLNQRVGKVITTTGGTTTTYFVHGGSGQVIEERDASNSLLARYTYAPGIDKPLTMERGGDTFYYHRDAQGSITEITGQSGQLIEQITYDIYGTATFRDGSGNPLTESAAGNPYLYTARRVDPETGNYYFRARMYNPQTGRFMQVDPAGFIDGMNLYASYFVVNGVDPSGQAAGAFKLFSAGGFTGLGAEITVSTTYDFKDCCLNGVTKSNGLRKYGLKLTIEGGLGLSGKINIAGRDVIDLGIKGPKLGVSAELAAKNTTCGGPVTALEYCEAKTVFAGGSASVGSAGFSVALTAGIKGEFKTCGTVSNGVLSVTSDFCGESNINITFKAGRYSGVLWQPSGYKVTGCTNIGTMTLKLPG